MPLIAVKIRCDACGKVNVETEPVAHTRTGLYLCRDCGGNNPGVDHWLESVEAVQRTRPPKKTGGG